MPILTVPSGRYRGLNKAARTVFQTNKVNYLLGITGPLGRLAAFSLLHSIMLSGKVGTMGF